MVDVDKAVIAKLKAQGEIFEILVDCDNAILLKSNKNVDINDILAADKIFSDAKKGLLASESKINAVFKTTDIKLIAAEIIKKGEIQVTAEHRKKLVEQKRKQILDYIHRTGVDPKTGFCHPLKRIELAFDEAKVHIDEYKSVEEQVHDIIKKLKPILPISFEKKEIFVKIPPEYAAKGYSAVHGFGILKNQDWHSDGSWSCNIEISAGIANDLIDKLNQMTRGSVETSIKK